MSGKLIFKVRKGRSLDWRYPYYPEWYLEAEDENNGTKIQFSPKYDELADIFKQMLIHEFINDWQRGNRNPDYTRKRERFREIFERAQTDFENYWKSPENIPLIYYQCNVPKHLFGKVNNPIAAYWASKGLPGMIILKLLGVMIK